MHPIIIYLISLALSVVFVLSGLYDKQIKTLKLLTKIHVIIATSIFWFIAFYGIFNGNCGGIINFPLFNQSFLA